jgi:hypothetical protein
METELQTNQEALPADSGVTETTGVSESQAAEAKMLSQDEVNRIIAERVERERKKFEKRFDGVDLDRYRQLTEAEEARKVEDQKRRGEFENILKDTVTKKDTVISGLQTELQNIKVDGNLLNAASTARAVNPQQVVALLKNQIRLGESGDVEVLDPKTGTVRYTESGDLMSINHLVNEFLQTNPHFVSATPSGSGTTGNPRATGGEAFDPLQADLSDPVQRAKYAEWRKTQYTNFRKVG